MIITCISLRALAIVATLIACQSSEKPRAREQPPRAGSAALGAPVADAATAVDPVVFTPPRHPLLIAAIAGDISAVREQLAKGADPGLDEDGRSAVVFAAAQGHLDVVVLLLHEKKVGASQREQALVSAAGAGQRAVVERLLQANVSVNASEPHGLTPLILGAFGGQTEIVELLLGRGADPNRQNADHETALHAAAANPGADTIAPMLIKRRARLDLTDKWGRTPLNVHAAAGRLRAVVALLDAGSELEHEDGDGQTPLTSAAFNGHVAVVAELLRRGANKDHVSKLGATPAMAAAQGGYSDVLTRLADAGADLRHAHKDGRDALRIAIEADQPRAVEVLLDRGVPLRAAAGAKESPMMVAAMGGATR